MGSGSQFATADILCDCSRGGGLAPGVSNRLSLDRSAYIHVLGTTSRAALGTDNATGMDVLVEEDAADNWEGLLEPACFTMIPTNRSGRCSARPAEEKIQVSYLQFFIEYE